MLLDKKLIEQIESVVRQV